MMASAPTWKYVPLQMIAGWIVPTVWLETRLIGVVKATSTTAIIWLNGGRRPDVLHAALQVGQAVLEGEPVIDVVRVGVAGAFGLGWKIHAEIAGDSEGPDEIE